MVPEPPPRDARLAQRFVALADTLVDDYDVVDLLERLVASCVEFLDVDAAGLLLVDAQHSLRLVASSDEDARLLELFQIQHDEGPCLDSLRRRAVVSAPDLESQADRWPRFSPLALSLGFHSVHAVPLRLRDEQIGGLNLFGTKRRRLRDADQKVAQALADVATIGILQQRSIHRAAQLADQLQAALDSRVVIEQAKGVIAQGGGLDMQRAYDALRGYARSHNRRISDVATEVVHGTLPAGSLLERRPRRDG